MVKFCAWVVAASHTDGAVQSRAAQTYVRICLLCVVVWGVYYYT